MTPALRSIAAALVLTFAAGVSQAMDTSGGAAFEPSAADLYRKAQKSVDMKLP